MVKHGMIFAAALMLGCSSSGSTAPSGGTTTSSGGTMSNVFYEDTQLGYKVTDFDLFFKPYAVDSSTGLNYRKATGLVHIDGLGDHHVTVGDYADAFYENGTPVQGLEITDEETGDVVAYAYAPPNLVQMGPGPGVSGLLGPNSLAIMRRPGANPGDPTVYGVVPWNPGMGVVPVSGKEMADQLSKNVLFEGASPFGMVMAYANANVFVSWHCNRTSPDQRCFGDANNVCVLFADLCDCALCKKLGRAECPLCK